MAGLATECPSIEVAGAGQRAGQALAGRGAYSLVQLSGVDQLPVTGAFITVAPIKLEGGSGAPSRVLAVLPRSRGAEGVETAEGAGGVGTTTRSEQLNINESKLTAELHNNQPDTASLSHFHLLLVLLMSVAVSS